MWVEPTMCLFLLQVSRAIVHVSFVPATNQEKIMYWEALIL